MRFFFFFQGKEFRLIKKKKFKNYRERSTLHYIVQLSFHMTQKGSTVICSKIKILLLPFLATTTKKKWGQLLKRKTGMEKGEIEILGSYWIGFKLKKICIFFTWYLWVKIILFVREIIHVNIFFILGTNSCNYSDHKVF